MPRSRSTRALAHLFVEVDENLRIAVRARSVGHRLQQPGSQRPVVVDLAVEDHLDGAVFVAERLIAAGQVDDRQAAMNQADAGAGPEALGVRAAVGDAVAHCLEDSRITGRPPSAYITPAIPHMAPLLNPLALQAAGAPSR